MIQDNNGVLFVISAPSGAGKGTVLKKVIEDNDKVMLSISATTRKARPGEVDGKDYFFVTKDYFSTLIKENKMLEYAQYCGNYYGTPKNKVQEFLNKGIDVILEIDSQGAYQIKKNIPDSVLIFILPPSLEELKNRLTNRNTEDIETISKRLKVAVEEIKKSDGYDYIIINDNVDICADSMIKIMDSEKMRAHRVGNLIKEVLCDE